MSLTVTSNTQTATVSTEHTIHTQSTPCSFGGQVDLKNLAAGDVVEISVYNKTLTGDTLTPGTTKPMWKATKSGPQAKAILPFPAFIVGFECKVTIKQIAGTGRDFPWMVGALA